VLPGRDDDVHRPGHDDYRQRLRALFHKAAMLEREGNPSGLPVYP
jgi:hypothetical protein